MPKGQRASKEQKKPSKAKLASKTTTPITGEIKAPPMTVILPRGKKKDVQ
jgi:hypothetical protein